MFKPYPHQAKAISQLRNGNVLVGGTGSGKSLVAMVYYYTKVLKGSYDPFLPPQQKINLFVITTAMKRDRLDWEKLATSFRLSTNTDVSINGIRLCVDSWNNINKYEDASGSFFIFDEQRTSGGGSWSKSFIKITKKNQWLMLTATPADRWIDLISVFIANGFYRNKTEFLREHVEFHPYSKYPKIKKYHNVDKLKRLKNSIFVVMDYRPPVMIKHAYVRVESNTKLLRSIEKSQWNIYKDKPIRNRSEFVHVLRRINNSDTSRTRYVSQLIARVKRLIIFYNFDYELSLLRTSLQDYIVAEHNGHRHDPLPEGDTWVYLVQYASGNEAWECLTTPHMLFYSLSYSHRIMVQSRGRINRLSSPFKILYYYYLVSDYKLDREIRAALSNKKTFNEKDLNIQFNF